MIYLILIAVFFVAMGLYFRIADHYNIVDKPNERSSHSDLTIRGGGVIYLLAAVCALVLHPSLWMTILGLFIIGTISFIDDRVTLSRRIRIAFHLIAVTLIFIATNVFEVFPWYLYIALYIVVIGIINAYNFMDGINGITGTYSLVVLLGLQYINLEIIEYVNPDFIWLPVLASIVFLFFNFRKKAKCFAGDVGSITVALWIVFLLLKLIIKSDNYSYILFLAVYGVDSILTIFHRLLLKQNIFEAHRLHFYQILANEQKWPHLWVSSLFAILQTIIILMVIYLPMNFGYLFMITVIPLVLFYFFIKKTMLKSNTKEVLN